MPKNLYLILLFCTFFSFARAQNFYSLNAYVYDSLGGKLVGASVRVLEMKTGTQTNEEGLFQLILPEGYHQINVSFLGYKAKTLEVELISDSTVYVVLNENAEVLDDIVVKVKKKDLSYEIIRNAIESREHFLKQYRNVHYQSYIQSVELAIKPPKKKEEAEEEQPEEEYNFYESTSEVFEERPNKRKEIRNAVKKIGEQADLLFTDGQEAEINLYQSLQQIKSLGDNALVSPISPVGLISYKYRLLDTYRDSLDRLVYCIEVRPKKLGNALYSGELEIYERSWFLKTVNLSLPKKVLLRYNSFSFSQEYRHVGDKVLLNRSEYQWKAAFGQVKKEGSTHILHSNYSFDSTYSKSFFGAEIAHIEQKAYEKDSLFWATQRKEKVKKEAEIYLAKRAKELQRMESPEYLDSLDSEDNKLTFKKLAFRGFGVMNRQKKQEWGTFPLAATVNPFGFGIGGWRVNQGLFYQRHWKNKRRLSVQTALNFGLLNKDLLGSVNTYWLYNPIKRSSLSMVLKRGINLINPYATVSDFAKRSNFYLGTGISVFHRTELFNGFFLQSTLSYSKRQDLSNYRFGRIGDDLFSNNEGLYFQSTEVLKPMWRIEYTPKQFYASEPYEKIILGSKFPTFYANITQAFSLQKGFKPAFNHLEFGLNQQFNVGIFGQSSYRVSASKFFDKKQLAPMDYKYQRGGDRYWFSPSMYSYQLLPKTITTLDWAYESHFEHHFNGFLMSKIPLLNKSGLNVVFGGGLFYSPENSTKYAETFAGVNRVFGLGRIRFRFGVYGVAAKSNTFGFDRGIKFSIEPYNIEKKKWGF
ncbi:DUF5686 and carboxypeptidase regulatory-like domain-containing protein [Marinilongibacter aquaticus]|uniref:DUF5686 and carboxypeptidase regulatory-like domain-containing protein n=1 Tax=Marinilongibacter aquaticus TaxID=2975157 RepID=UPI0021BDB21D|nr:DUF5686 and carboxypeptidase regulatory-like domain-containing protein [Marinilongibacter aquaticus]UBM57507.1 DUF5686 and carboxypeptidase regulatory-like domain-containing protein [Marinilongibacter aquaticus]